MKNFSFGRTDGQKGVTTYTRTFFRKFGYNNTDNPLERNVIFGSENALAQLNMTVIFVMAKVRASNL